MKKILIALLTSLIALLYIAPSVQAVEVGVTDIHPDTITWSVVLSGGTYLLQSQRFELMHDDYEISIGAIFDGYEQQVFVLGQSDFRIYSEPLDLAPTQIYSLVYSAPNEYMEPYNPVGPGDPINWSAFKTKYLQIRLQFNTWLTPTQRSLIRTYMNNVDYNGLKYDFTMNGFFDEDLETHTVAQLPLTTGSPFTSVGNYGDATFSYVDGDFFASIFYYDYYSLEIPDVVLPSDDFLENVSDTWYYSYDDEKFLYFQYENEENYFMTDAEYLTKKWKGYALWNLTTNEVMMVDRVYALVYIEVEEDRQTYAYTFFPDVAMDDLLSASVTFSMRYGEKHIGTLFQQKYTPWQNVSVVLQKDQTSIGAMHGWASQVLTASRYAMAIGSLLSMIPNGQYIAIPLLLAGGISSTLIHMNALDLFFNGNIEDITKINFPQNTLVDLMEDHFHTLTGNNYDLSVTTDKLYQLNLGVYDDPNSNFVEIDNESFKFVEVVWSTEGEVVAASGPQVVTDAIVNEDYTALRPDETDLGDVIGSAWMGFMIPVITLAFVLMGWKSGAFKDLKIAVAFIVFYIIIIMVVG